LRFRLLGPLLAAAVLAAILVAIASYRLGHQWANAELQTRFTGIKNTLANSTFPLNGTVLDSLAELTQTELLTIGPSGSLRYSTLKSLRDKPHNEIVIVDNKRYLVFEFATRGGDARSDRVARVAVLFDEQTQAASRQRAAVLPLVTGLSTVLALSTISLVLTSRLVTRIGRLQRCVESIAAGDFQTTATDHVPDEIGRLGGAVDAMAVQLNQLWKQLNRQQSEKLLHQIAGGMAHQLRNSLTGARMAVELHEAQCQAGDAETLQVAIRQIEASEDYVRRLLLVASGRQDQDRPMAVATCWKDLQSSLSPIAAHLKINLQWHLDGSIAESMSEPASSLPLQIKDGPNWIAAVSNLVHNAIQAGDQVHVQLKRTAENTLTVCVRDNGNGIDPAIANELFEPFVTSKPEGMGLGLSVVRRAAEYLGGDIHWQRDDDWTEFIFTSTLTS
jgi:signal transduction histidine kinase